MKKNMYTCTSEPPLGYSDAMEAQALAKILAWIPPPPQPQQFPRLPVPVAVPQIEPNTFRSGPMPFYRAYSHYLLRHAIIPEDFISFVDNLTIALAPSPAFQALQVAGTGIGFVPHHWAQVASGAIGMAANAGTRAVSATRCKLYMQKVNEEFFAPRGLKASIASDEELRNTVKEDPLQAPLVPLNQSTSALTLVERRLQALDRYIAPLTFDVPAPEQRSNVLDQLSAKQIQAKMKRNRGKAIKEAEKRGLRATDQLLTPVSSSMSRSVSRSHHTEDDDSLSDEGDSGQRYPQELSEESNKKLRELNLKIQEITLKAERKIMREDKESKREKIERERRKDIEKLQEKFDKELGQSRSGESRRASRQEGQESWERSRSRRNSKSGKREEKEWKKAAKLKWVVIENIS